MGIAFKILKRGKYLGNDRKKYEQQQLKLLMELYKQAYHNQVLWMLEALLTENAWHDAEQILIALGPSLDV